MPELTLTPADQRELLRAFLAQPEVKNQVDPFRRTWDELVAECRGRDELALGIALVALIGLRAVGREAEAAGVLLALSAQAGQEWREAGGGGS